jgi:hypothetical protein
MLTLATLVVVGSCFALGRYFGGGFQSQQTPPFKPDAKVIPTPSRASPRPAQEDSAEQREAMSEALLTMFSDEASYERYGNFFTAIQRLSLPNIRELHARLVQMPGNSYFLEAVAARWVELDPATASDYVHSLPDGTNMRDDWGLLAAWARRMPESAISEGLRQQTTSKGREMLTNAFLSLAQTDPVSAAARIQLISDAKIHDQVFGAILTSWARSDPEAAARWVQSHPESYRTGSGGNLVIETFAANLAVRDPALATQFAQSLPDPIREGTLIQACREWAFCDAEKALTWCRQNGVAVDSTASDKACILAHAMKRAPEKTLAWLGSIPPGEGAQLAVTALHYAPVRVAPQIFAMIPAEDQPDNVAPLMKVLNDHRTGDARAWATSLEEGPLREAALSNLMLGYTFKNPVALIDGLPAGPSRDAAYAAHIENTGRLKGEPDVQQLEKITDIERRENAAISAYYQWRSKAQVLADKWLETTPHIPAAQKTRMRAE